MVDAEAVHGNQKTVELEGKSLLGGFEPPCLHSQRKNWLYKVISYPSISKYTGMYIHQYI